MLPIVLELIDELKTCLPIAFLISFIFGYLYTKLKAREKYYPDIKSLSKKIQNHSKNLKRVSTEHNKLKSEIENYENKLKGINNTILEAKNQFASKKSLEIEIIEESKMLNSKYKEKNSILAHYMGEIESVKKECRLDDVSNIEENKQSMNRLMEEKELLLKEKKENFSMIQKKMKGLDLDNIQLENKFHEFGKRIENLSSEIKVKENRVQFLESEFIKEYEELLDSVSSSQSKLKELKQKLIKLKDTYQ